MSEVHLVTVVAPYTQHAHPRSGHGRMNGSTYTIRGRFQMPLRGIPEREASPVATLHFAEGGAITLREHGGQLYRPVLEPGGFGTLGVEEFAEACAGADPWRDDPFRTREDGYGSTDTNRGPRSVLDQTHEPDEYDWRLVGDNDMAKVAERLRLQATDVLVIGGVVHVCCPQPRLLLKNRFDARDKGTEAVLTWSLPRLEGDDHPEAGPSVLEPLREHERNMRDPVRRRLSFHEDAWRWFGLRDLDAAAAFGEALAARQGLPFSVEDRVVTVHDPRVLKPHPGPAPKGSAEAALSRVGMGLERRPRAVVEAWLDARDASAAGDHHAALMRLGEAFSLRAPGAGPSKDLDWGPSTTSLSAYRGGPALLRYVLVEGAAAPSAEESMEDDLSLAALANGP